MDTLETRIHFYRFDVSRADEAAQYDKLCEELRNTPGRGRWLHVWAGGPRPADGTQVADAYASGDVIELDPTHLFDNQWNTTAGARGQGFRVFDWFEGIYPNRSIRSGHYLDITDEIREVRRTYRKCGYCGRIHAPGEEEGQLWVGESAPFCLHCIGNEFLKPEDLRLLRLATIDAHDHHRPQLNARELELIQPIYDREQADGRLRRAARDLERARAKAERDREAARIKYEGELWLIEHGLDPANWMYYAHAGKWVYGWRQPIEEAEGVPDALTEAPFEYQVKWAGRGPSQ